jgi:hypothetical protein
MNLWGTNLPTPVPIFFEVGLCGTQKQMDQTGREGILDLVVIEELSTKDEVITFPFSIVTTTKKGTFMSDGIQVVHGSSLHLLCWGK